MDKLIEKFFKSCKMGEGGGGEMGKCHCITNMVFGAMSQNVLVTSVRKWPSVGL